LPIYGASMRGLTRRDVLECARSSRLKNPPDLVAGDGMPRPLEARVAGSIHVQQITRAGPLLAVCRLLIDAARR
jgi:hypothetical protein